MKYLNNQKKLKSYVLNFVKKNNIETTSSSRHCYHIRFKLKGTIKEFNELFNPINIEVIDSDKSCSSKSLTYILKTLCDINDISKETELYWVNNEVSISKTGSKLFATKDLIPDNLNITDKLYSCDELIKSVTLAIYNKKYEKQIENQLIELLKYSKQNSTEVKIDNELTFSNADLSVISKDYGEILSAIWVMSNLNFNKVYFPKNSNEKLIDFYAKKVSICYPISVKSGSGGKVLLQNIIDAIKKRKKTLKKNINNQPSMKIIKIVNENSMKTQMIKIHQYLETKMIEDLSIIMNTKVDDINEKLVKEWANNNSVEELKNILVKWWKNYSEPTKLDVRDRERLIVSPLGEEIKRILNNNKKLKESLTYLARNIAILQINIDVKKSKLIFRKSFFKDSKFKFDWPGYSSGNKLGFIIGN